MWPYNNKNTFHSRSGLTQLFEGCPNIMEIRPHSCENDMEWACFQGLHLKALLWNWHTVLMTYQLRKEKKTQHGISMTSVNFLRVYLELGHLNNSCYEKLTSGPYVCFTFYNMTIITIKGWQKVEKQTSQHWWTSWFDTVLPLPFILIMGVNISVHILGWEVVTKNVSSNWSQRSKWLPLRIKFPAVGYFSSIYF